MAKQSSKFELFLRELEANPVETLSHAFSSLRDDYIPVAFLIGNVIAWSALSVFCAVGILGLLAVNYPEGRSAVWVFPFLLAMLLPLALATLLLSRQVAIRLQIRQACPKDPSAHSSREMQLQLLAQRVAGEKGLRLAPKLLISSSGVTPRAVPRFRGGGYVIIDEHLADHHAWTDPSEVPLPIEFIIRHEVAHLTRLDALRLALGRPYRTALLVWLILVAVSLPYYHPSAFPAEDHHVGAIVRIFGEEGGPAGIGFSGARSVGGYQQPTRVSFRRVVFKVGSLFFVGSVLSLLTHHICHRALAGASELAANKWASQTMSKKTAPSHQLLTLARAIAVESGVRRGSGANNVTSASTAPSIRQCVEWLRSAAAHIALYFCNSPDEWQRVDVGHATAPYPDSGSFPSHSQVWGAGLILNMTFATDHIIEVVNAATSTFGLHSGDGWLPSDGVPVPWLARIASCLQRAQLVSDITLALVAVAVVTALVARVVLSRLSMAKADFAAESSYIGWAVALTGLFVNVPIHLAVSWSLGHGGNVLWSWGTLFVCQALKGLGIWIAICWCREAVERIKASTPRTPANE